jgi:hypothetical protein
MYIIYINKCILCFIFIFIISVLIAQIDVNSIFGNGNTNTNTEQLIQNLSGQVASADPYFSQAYDLLNLQVPVNPVYNPGLIQEAESHYAHYRYLLGVIRARSKFIYDTKQEIIRLKSDYQKANPLPNINYDTHSTIDNQTRYKAEQIKARTRAYDAAVSCVDTMYKKYQAKIMDLVNSASKLSGYIINYKATVEYIRDQAKMNTSFVIPNQMEENRGMKDAGGMSDTQYKMRSFALNVLIPIFDNAAKTNPYDSADITSDTDVLAKALEGIFKILPKP